MASGLRRFLNLERPRKRTDRSDPTSPSLENGRFDALEPVKRIQEPGELSAKEEARFAGEAEPLLELAVPDERDRPFTRCMKCGRDHGRSETTCLSCGISLDSDEQREFNDRLWEEKKLLEERARKEPLLAAEERHDVESEEVKRMRREMGIAIALEVGRSERARLHMGDGSLFFGHEPFGRVLLEFLPEKARVPVLLFLGAAVLASLVIGLFAKSALAILLALVVGIVLVAPRIHFRGPDGF